MGESFDRIVCGDCLVELGKLRPEVADLVFADPPFNIGYEYDQYDDRLEYEKYEKWTGQWMESCRRILKPDGSFYVAIGDEFAAEVRLIGRRLGLHLRNWIIWYYTFGQSTSKKFARSHTHIFYFAKNKLRFYFNDRAVRILSDRQKQYDDRRASERGKLPDDVWVQFPRVCGTFRERLGEHPCQMPESLLMRIIRASCPPGGLVVDPFAGSGTTLVAALKLGRRFFGVELSGGYVEAAERRLEAARRELGRDRGLSRWPAEHIEELKRLYQENEVPTDRLAGSAQLLMAFTQQFNARIEPQAGYEPEDVMRQLRRLRKSAALPRIRAHVVERPDVGGRAGEAMLFDSG